MLRPPLSRLVVCLLLSLFASMARAQAAPVDSVFSLGDALRLMRASHPLIEASRQDIRALDADVITTRLWTNPAFGGTYFKGVANSSYDHVGYLYYAITQFVELSNAPGARKRAARLLASAARADLTSVEAQLSLDLESALIDLVAAKRLLGLTERLVELLQSAGNIVNDRVSAGAAPRYDATRIAVTLATAHADLGEAQAGVARAWAELRGAIGPRAQDLRGEPAYELDVGPRLPDVGTLLARLSAERPDLEAARRRADSANEAIGVAKRSVLPGVGLTVNGGYGAGPRQVDVGMGLSVEIPVVEHGQGTIPAARARARGARAQVDALLAPAAQRIQGMHDEVATRQRALEEYKARGVASGDEMLSEAQAGYVAGRFSVLELADAYRAWRDARLRVIQLAAAARQAEIDLGRELGRPLRDL